MKYPWNQMMSFKMFKRMSYHKRMRILLPQQLITSATSPLKISGDLKRNLHDIYDVDGGDDGDANSIKSNRESLGEDTPVWVPKVEK
uniref:Uncharacterized protein n=1 Tax=Lactuca sativa TaxID=4236 RepID=A0A9R1WAP0_LACSA|nr:hypothetical protein LSAT_V11C200090850 [Lactuca sativa]